MNENEKIIRAFPTEIRDEVSSLLDKISIKSIHKDFNTFTVMLRGEKLEIPYRIYFEEQNEENLNKTELLILNCLFTRHSNGFVRQRNLEPLLLAENY